MGCFSFICQKCGRGIKSSSFSGENTHLFLLKDGKVIQQMTGEYDSYGRVFIDDTQHSEVDHSLRESIHWKDPFPEKPNDRDYNGWIWGRVCDLMHDDNYKNGIAAIHVSCYDGKTPEFMSEGDPNQGWGAEDDEKNYFASSEGEGSEYPLPKPIPGYDVAVELKRVSLRGKIFRLQHDLKFEKMMLESKEIMSSDDIPEDMRINKDLINFYQDNVNELQNKLNQYQDELKDINNG